MEAGDVIVVPQGETHMLGSSPTLDPVSLAPLLAKQVATNPGGVMAVVFGGGGKVTRMVCGFLAAQDIARNPLLAALPRLFKVSMRGSSASWLESALRFAAEEAASTHAGTATILAKLSELVFVEAIRRYVETMPDDRKGWLAGLRDRFIARALSQRFSELLGVPPMQYLAQWRPQLAAQQLRLADRPLARVAEDIGYESEAAFSRAFKREYGVPPATWRRNIAAAAVQ